jgi:SAM-dependent methyltransferase
MKTSSSPNHDEVRAYVRERYGAIAAQAGTGCGCTTTGCCGGNESEIPPASYGEKLGYTSADLKSVPAGSDLGLGCGNPVAMASIRRGETVLDLGSGAGFDCFLAARQLAGTGRVIGVDMTPAMITKARANARKGGYQNVEFRLGEIEALPIEDASVDLILSNCVINLSPEKTRVLHEAFRVLKSGGRLAIADIVATQPLPVEMKSRLEAIGACVGGATLVSELHAMLVAAGFNRIDIVLKEPSRALIREWTDDPRAGDFVVSALITAHKD